MVSELLRRSRGSVIATCRNPQGAVALMELAAKHPTRVDVVACDLLQRQTIETMGTYIATKYKQVDCLMNVAGVLHDGPDFMPEKSLAAIQDETMVRVFRTNAVGPVMVAQALQPLLKKGSVVASVSARVGSIGDNRLGGWWSYRMSKAALNMGELPAGFLCS